MGENPRKDEELEEEEGLEEEQEELEEEEDLEDEQEELEAEGAPDDEPEDLDDEPEDLDDEPEDDGEPPDLEHRILCSDGACIGIIGNDGKCKECGKEMDAEDAPMLEAANEAAAEAGEEEEEDGDDREDEPDEDDDEPPGMDDRELCPDGACIGIIGPDGKCKECGRDKDDIPED